ncbi:MAG: putative flap endonuclease-1-like 5' DNA nuclease, partial [Bacteroidia bacterium]
PSKPAVVETTETMSPSIGGQKDDLKKIEGIGPKIEELLYTDGIYTYKQVIASSVERIKGILIAAGPNYAVHDPSTWGEQASLADSGGWEKLDALQEELKGGKRKG